MTKKYELLPDTIDLYIGGRDRATGNFIPHLSKGRSPNEFKEYIQTVFGNDAEPVTEENLEKITIKFEAALQKFSDKLINAIDSSNLQLFRKLFDYDKEGAIKLFAQIYDRMKAGVKCELSHLEAALAPLSAYTEKEFLSTNPFIYIHNQWIPNSNNVVARFSEAIHILIMNMFTVYHIAPEVFHHEKSIANSIKKIEQHLSNMLLNCEGRGTDYLYDYLIRGEINGDTRIEKYKRIKDDQLIESKLLKYIPQKLSSPQVLHLRNGHFKDYNLMITDQFYDDHFNQILDMLGILNFIKTAYDDYVCNSKSGSNDLRDVHAFEIILQLGHSPTITNT